MYSMILVYLFLTIPQLFVLFGVTTGILGFSTLAAVLYRLFGTEDPYGRTIPGKIPGANRMLKWLISLFVVSGLFTTLVPSKETSYAMAAAYVAQEAVQSELGQSAIKLLQSNINEAISKMEK